ncbi:MAG: hypothetical protein RIC95_03735 [Vicingaceae bacterium]
MSRLKIISIILLCFLLSLFSEEAKAQFYNGTQTSFGKNRVQYDKFEWQFYRFRSFETYFYTGGKELAQHTAYYANHRISEIEKFLDFYPEERIQFIIYNKQSHFRQSNIGLSTTQNYNIGGVSRIVGSKVFVYFEGDYAKFEQQLDAGIYRVLIYQMVFGGDWKQVLRNSALLSLPDWYINGLVSYLAYPNDPLINSRIKDGIQNGDFERFNTLTNEEASIAGHAIWQYVADTYGEKVISDILYMTQVNREIDDGFLYVIGIPFETLYQEWYNNFEEKYKAESKGLNELGEKVDFKVRKRKRYQNFIEGPNQRYQVYTENRLGKYKIYLYDKETEKRKKIFRAEQKLERIQDYSYPITGFHPDGNRFNFITEEKGDVLLYTYQIKEEKLSVKPILKLEKVLSFDYAPNGKEMVFSAISKGQSDLYLYNMLGNTQKKLTDDIYSDTKPVYSQNGSSIYFSSDRPNDSLNQEKENVDRFDHEKDIFEFRLNREAPLSFVTNTTELSETNPIVADKLYYLSNQEGEIHRHHAVYDSSISSIDTTVNYRYYYKLEDNGASKRNILFHNSTDSSTVSQLSFLNSQYQLFTKPTNEQAALLTDDRITKEVKTYDSDGNTQQFIAFEQLEPSEAEVDPSNYSFDGNTPAKPKSLSQKDKGSERISTDLEFPTQRLYKLNFRPENSVLQLNNNFITGQYQVFNGGPYTNPGVGVNTTIGIVDLMENHRVYGSFRYSGDLIEYGLSYQNLTKRLDKEYTFSRRRLRNADNFNPFDRKTLQGSVSLIWPFNEVMSIRGVVQARNDKTIPLSSDRFNLQRDIINEYWASLKTAFIFDNTRDIALNIRYGTRYKIFAEQYQLVYNELENSPTQDLTVVGFDFRHYQKIHRELIGVFRTAGSKSFGSTPLIYYLGGVDEWWRSDIYNEDTPIDFTQNYGFQALAANMRGFLQNIRNGNNFAVVNTEIRWPVFSYFINRPIQSDIVRNFQIVGFGDLGTAWVGETPFADDNPINNEEQFFGQDSKVVYENINDPLVAGLGFGLRTTLLGYFVRADWAWGVQNGFIADKPLFMFSLSLDI